MALVNNLDDLERLLKLCKDSNVKVFKSGDLSLVIGDEFEVAPDDDDEIDEKTPRSTMGFETIDVRGLGVQTDFDE